MGGASPHPPGGLLVRGGGAGQTGPRLAHPFPPPPRAVLLWRAARARGFAAGNEAEAGLIPGSRLGGGRPPGPPPQGGTGGHPRGGAAVQYAPGTRAAVSGESPKWVSRAPPQCQEPAKDSGVGPQNRRPQIPGGWW